MSTITMVKLYFSNLAGIATATAQTESQLNGLTTATATATVAVTISAPLTRQQTIMSWFWGI